MPAVPEAAPDAAAALPPEMLDLLEGRALAHLATVRGDGRPHVTPVWIDHEGGDLLVNVRVDRVKAANLRRRRVAAISVVDPENPYRYLTVTGEVTGWTEEGWQEHMNSLALRYMGLPSYPWFFAGERRLIFRITPRRVYFERGDEEIPES